MKAEALKRVTWECIHFHSNPEEVLGLEDSGLLVFAADLGNAKSERDVLRIIAEALAFPGYFGQNWDALDECLCDLSWLPRRSGYTLVVRHVGDLWRGQPWVLGKLLQCWLGAAEEWSKTKTAFHLLVELPRGE